MLGTLTLSRLLEILPTAAMWVVAVFGGLFVLILLVKTMLQICPPNEVLIFSGRRHRMADGSVRGFRVVFGGRGWYVPMFNTVSRMRLNTMEVPIAIRGAYSKGGIPLNVDAIANVKISSSPEIVGNAIERFLGRDMNEIRRVSKETLEGHLRGVLATLTPEEVNEDRLKFADSLAKESEEDLNKLGLHLDVLKIQHVADEVHYLDSIGREAIANVVRDAEMAESDAKREAELAEAEAMGRAQSFRSQVEANVAQMKNELRRVQADLEAQVRAEEERTAAAAREARALAEQEFQQVRAEVEGIRLQSDTVLPAEAQQVAQEFRARGDAASIRERGTALGEALGRMQAAWAVAGDRALQIALIEDLDKILAAAASGVSKVQIDHLQMIDGGEGKTFSGYIGAYPAMLMEVLEAVRQTTGIDVRLALSGEGGARP